MQAGDLYLRGMLQRMQSYLAQPYPGREHARNYGVVILIFTLFVGGFLAYFQPFGLNLLPGTRAYWVAAGFGLVTGLTLTIFYLITRLFPNYFMDDNWSLGKELAFSLLNFMAVAHANYGFAFFVLGASAMSYLGMVLSTFAIGFFPYMFLLLTNHLRTLKKNVEEAHTLTAQINPSSESNRTELLRNKTRIELKGDNEGDFMSLDLQELLQVQSSGNYVEVRFLQNGKLMRMVLRTSLKSIEAELESFPEIFRCHRKHLINIHLIKEVLGNSQGYRLKMHEDLEEVPVSRSRNAAFKQVVKEKST